MVLRETFYFCSHQMTLYTHWTPCWQIISIVVTVTGRCWHLKGPDLTDAERPKYFGQFTRGLAMRASHSGISIIPHPNVCMIKLHYPLTLHCSCEDLFRDCKWSSIWQFTELMTAWPWQLCPPCCRWFGLELGPGLGLAGKCLLVAGSRRGRTQKSPKISSQQPCSWSRMTWNPLYF